MLLQDFTTYKTSSSKRTRYTLRRPRIIRRPFESYLQIKTPYKYKEAIKNITGTKNIILKQDKGRRVVILNHRYDIEKCLKILVSDQFK